jgi:hypothetical protein
MALEAGPCAFPTHKLIFMEHVRHPDSATSSASQRTSTPGFDLAFALLSILFTAGGVIDTWAHSFDVAGAQETFFTPWHALFYISFFLIAALLGSSIWRGWRTTRSLVASVPQGYELSVLGLAIFLSGGLLDFIWHAIAGREVSLEILINPAHMIFIVGSTLVIIGPFRALWRRQGQPVGFIGYLPVLLPLLLLQWDAVFPTLYAHPIQATSSTNLRGTILFMVSGGVGTIGIMWYVAVLMVLILLALRRWRLPFGSYTLMIGGHFLMLAPLNMNYSGVLALVGAALAGGAGIDILALLLKPAYYQPVRLFAFAFLSPVLLYSLYFAAIYAMGQMAWSLHLVVGNIVIAGVIGLAAAGVFSTVATLVAP